MNPLQFEFYLEILIWKSTTIPKELVSQLQCQFLFQHPLQVKIMRVRKVNHHTTSTIAIDFLIGTTKKTLGHNLIELWTMIFDIYFNSLVNKNLFKILKTYRSGQTCNRLCIFKQYNISQLLYIPRNKTKKVSQRFFFV